MAQPKWVTPAGSLGTIPEGIYYSVPVVAAEPVTHETVYYRVISGSLPRGVVCSDTGVVSGVPTVSKTTVSKFTIRAYTKTSLGTVDRLIDRTFSLTVSGDIPPEFITPAGLLFDAFTGTFISTPVPGTTEKTYGYQIEYTQSDVSTVRLIDGELPNGISINDKGLLTGFILPTENLIWYNDYVFTLEVTNGKFSSLRTYNIGVYNRACLTADTTYITADNTWITADASPIIPPVVTNVPGSIGVTKVGNYFAYQFTAFDLQGRRVQFTPVLGDPIKYDEYPYKYDENFTTYDQGLLNIPLDLTLDPNSGWLYGRVAPIGVSSYTFEFGVAAYWYDDPTVIGEASTFTITVVDELLASVVWLYPSYLGSINNGSTSTFKVAATIRTGQKLYYRLPVGAYTALPQGLQLLPSGEISGRVSFQTFCLDGGTTTFDVTPVNGVSDPTTFDLDHHFAVEAYSLDGTISVTTTFTIHVDRVYNAPYQNLFITAMPPPEGRILLTALLENGTIFPDSRIYRSDDPFFGVAKNVTYWHCYGLTASTLDEYVAALQFNHYDKQLILGDIKTAQALDDTGNVIYEVVYSEIIDNLVNNDGVSISKSQVLAYPPVNASVPSNSIFVFPNSLENMRDQVIDTLGQTSNQLPRWMLSTQPNGSVLGFTTAWVIAYTNPGESGRVAYDVKQYMSQAGINLNQIDFATDRYTIDRVMDYYWNPVSDSWTPTPVITTFDTYLKPPDLVFQGWVDYGCMLSYFDVQWRSIDYINSIGGLDGVIDASINGKLMIFGRQQYYVDPPNAIIPGPLTDNQAWTDYYSPFSYDAFDSTVLDASRIIPGQLEAAITPGVINERMGIYLITVVDNQVQLTLVQNTATYDYVIVRGGGSYNNTSVYYPPAPGPNQTVVSWLQIPIIDPGATTFDKDSMQFVDPEIEYDEIVAGAGDAFVMYPRPDIIVTD